MRVQLIAHTPDPERLIAAAAKVCYSDVGAYGLYEGLDEEKTQAFIKRLSDMGHESPTEHVTYTFALEGVSRAFLAQITRHRLASFCVSGDTKVGYGQKTKGITIRELYNKDKQYQNMILLRSIDEESKEIINNHTVDVYYSGEKPVYLVKTFDGYTIKTTLEHRFFTTDGWKQLKDIKEGDWLYTNGIESYKSKDWLEYHYYTLKETQSQIASYCGVSKHTIRSWIRKFNLQKPTGSWTIGIEPPNKGRSKDDYAPLQSTSEKMKGNTNNKNRVYSHKGTADTVEYGYYMTHHTYQKTGICEVCGKEGNTELHHKDRNPRNYSRDNIEELCMDCHKRRHHHDAVKAVKPSQIESIEYVGVEDTYDIEMMAPYHNFVANGFVVHNSVQSQRYVKAGEPNYYIPDAIKKDLIIEDHYKTYIEEAYRHYHEIAWKLYNIFKNEGMNEREADKKAIENARYLLPNAACTNMVVTMNARELMHFFSLRCCNRAQDEIRDVADEMLKQCREVSPQIFKNAGPACIRGKCPEGKMTCGRPRMELKIGD